MIRMVLTQTKWCNSLLSEGAMAAAKVCVVNFCVTQTFYVCKMAFDDMKVLLGHIVQ